MAEKTEVGTAEDVQKYEDSLPVKMAQAGESLVKKGEYSASPNDEPVRFSKENLTSVDVEILEALLSRLRTENVGTQEQERKLAAAEKMIRAISREGENFVGWGKNFLKDREANVEGMAKKTGETIEYARRAILVGEISEKLSSMTGILEAETVLGEENLENLQSEAERGGLELAVVPPRELFGRKSDSEIMGLIFFHLISREGLGESIAKKYGKGEAYKEAKFAEQNIKSPWEDWVTTLSPDGGSRTTTSTRIAEYVDREFPDRRTTTLEKRSQFEDFLRRLTPPQDSEQRRNWKSPVRVVEGKFVLDLPPGSEKLSYVQDVLTRLNATTTLPDGVLVLEGKTVKGEEAKKPIWPELKVVGVSEVKGYTLDEWKGLSQYGRFDAQGDEEWVVGGRKRVGLAVASEKRWLEGILPEHGRPEVPFFLLRVLNGSPIRDRHGVGALALSEEADTGVNFIVQELPLSRADVDLLVEEILKERKGGGKKVIENNTALSSLRNLIEEAEKV